MRLRVSEKLQGDTKYRTFERWTRMVKNVDQTVCIIGVNKYAIIRVIEAIVRSLVFNANEQLLWQTKNCTTRSNRSLKRIKEVHIAMQ